MKTLTAGILLLLFMQSAVSQEAKELRYPVSYVAASVAYIGAGRDGHLESGDTMTIVRSSAMIGKVVITAVSKRSSASRIISQILAVKAGDSAVIVKRIDNPPPTEEQKKRISTIDSSRSSAFDPITPRSKENSVNIVTGRLGLQYMGALSDFSRLNISQPSLLLRMSIQNLYNTGLLLSIYGRSYYDLSDNYNRHGGDRLKNRVYDVSLQSTDPASFYGFGAGRITSEYVGSMGTFDGGQIFVRYDRFTAGFLYGAKVQDRSLEVNGNETKGAVFVNLKIGPDFLHQYNGTVAYGRQLVRGNLDREFIYLQNFVMMGSSLSLYESSEIELNDINAGVKEKKIKISNTFVSLNYYPLDWISTNVGFDGSRSVYLFESMKSLSDTLLDKNLMQGYRAGMTFRLPYYISIGGNLSYRTKKGDARDSRTISGTFRISDIAGTEIGGGVRYADIIGLYSNGSNMTIDLDRTLFSVLSLSFRYDYYRYVLVTLQEAVTTHTVTINSNYRFSRSVYSSLAVDGVRDGAVNTILIYAELGVRF